MLGSNSQAQDRKNFAQELGSGIERKDLADEEREGMEQGSELETRDKKR